MDTRDLTQLKRKGKLNTILCNRNTINKSKITIYKTIVESLTLYEPETWKMNIRITWEEGLSIATDMDYRRSAVWKPRTERIENNTLKHLLTKLWRKRSDGKWIDILGIFDYVLIWSLSISWVCNVYNLCCSTLVGEILSIKENKLLIKRSKINIITINVVFNAKILEYQYLFEIYEGLIL